MKTITLDGKKLKNISQASHTAEVTMLDLAVRERLRSFSDITRTKNKLIRNGEKIVEGDYMTFWKSLQDAGVGVIVYGRKGKPDRFEWHYSMKKVAKAAIDGTNESAEQIGSEKQEVKSAKTVNVSERSRPELKREAVSRNVTRLLYIPLRKDFNLEINVPNDLSKNEVEVINNALKRLSA